MARGRIPPDIDSEVAIDVVFGPAMYRVVVGHEPADESAADAIVDLGMRSMARCD